MNRQEEAPSTELRPGKRQDADAVPRHQLAQRRDREDSAQRRREGTADRAGQGSRRRHARGIRHLKEEFAKYAHIVKAAGIEAD